MTDLRTAPQPTSSRPAARRWLHIPALDGLRGLAVLGVVLYHAGVTWLPGGLLGVDAFFVLSGFLITGLLVHEKTASGRIDLGRFWQRRAKRLLPALLLLLILVSAQMGATGDPSERARFPKDALSALGYIANWRFAYSHQGYFTNATPSPLLHLWSLGVEEQFYLVWPLVVTLLLLRGSTRAVGRVAAAGALVSTVWMGLLSAGVGPAATTDRLYYGTDTRAAALLVGAALAVWQSQRGALDTPSAARGRGRWLVIGWAGLATTAAIWATSSGQAMWLYRGGFLLVALAVGAVVAAVCRQPDSVLARLLAIAPLAALGRISYGVYLLHWPLFLLLTHQRTGLAGSSLLLVRLASTAAAAVLSYLGLEQPIRTGRLRLPRPRLAVPLTAAATVAAVLTGSMLPASGGPEPQDLSAGAALLHHETVSRLAALPAAPTIGASSPTHEPVRVFIVGDSIAFSAAWALTSERERYKVDLLSEAIIGCGIMPDHYADPHSTSPIPLKDCTGWASIWTAAVQRFTPAVSAVFLGRWETVDRLVNGRDMHIGEPDFDRELSGLLDRAIDILSARSGKVALIALPCFALAELPDGSTSPADQPKRAARYNALLQQAVGRHPGVASVVDLNPQICPGGRVVSTYHGLPLRQPDGMHFDVRSGAALGPLLLEPLRRLVGAPARL